MEPAEQTMLDNLLKNTGKSLDEWVVIVKKENFQKHGEILKPPKKNMDLRMVSQILSLIKP